MGGNQSTGECCQRVAPKTAWQNDIVMNAKHNSHQQIDVSLNSDSRPTETKVSETETAGSLHPLLGNHNFSNRLFDNSCLNFFKNIYFSIE